MDIYTIALVLLSLWFLASFYYMYHFYSRNQALEEKLSKERAKELELKKELQASIEPKGEQKEQALEDISKIEEHRTYLASDDRHDRMWWKHWKKLEEKHEKEKADEISPEKKAAELFDEKQKLEDMIEVTRSRYHKWKLDEESFREITRDLSRRIVEIEAEINRIEKEKSEVETEEEEK
ncbi:hypothetical protein ACFLRC_01195 [Candidatus Altiarchaeota archaeon]